MRHSGHAAATSRFSASPLRSFTFSNVITLPSVRLRSNSVRAPPSLHRPTSVQCKVGERRSMLLASEEEEEKRRRRLPLEAECYPPLVNNPAPIFVKQIRSQVHIHTCHISLSPPRSYFLSLARSAVGCYAHKHARSDWCYFFLLSFCILSQQLTPYNAYSYTHQRQLIAHCTRATWDTGEGGWFRSSVRRRTERE